MQGEPHVGCKQCYCCTAHVFLGCRHATQYKDCTLAPWLKSREKNLVITCTFSCTRARARTSTFSRTRARAHTHTHIHRHARTRTHTEACTHMHTQTHARTRTHRHTHKQAITHTSTNTPRSEELPQKPPAHNTDKTDNYCRAKMEINQTPKKQKQKQQQQILTLIHSNNKKHQALTRSGKEEEKPAAAPEGGRFVGHGLSGGKGG